MSESTEDEGVLVALGNYESGYTLYIKDNKLVYEYNRGNAVFTIVSDQTVPVGDSTLKYEFDLTGTNENGTHQGIGSLYINNARVGEAVIQETHKFKLSFEGLDIGKDTTNYPVSETYAGKGELEFTGKIQKVDYQIEEAQVVKN